MQQASSYKKVAIILNFLFVLNCLAYWVILNSSDSEGVGPSAKRILMMGAAIGCSQKILVMGHKKCILAMGPSIKMSLTISRLRENS